jgi:hypothetical protein
MGLLRIAMTEQNPSLMRASEKKSNISFILVLTINVFENTEKSKKNTNCKVMRYLETSLLFPEQPIGKRHYRKIGWLLRSEESVKRISKK